MTISQKLEYLRQREGLSRYKASQLCGLHSDAFRRYERGEVAPSVKALKAISEYFQISLSDLIACDPSVVANKSADNKREVSANCRKKKCKSPSKRERSTRSATSRTESEQRENASLNSERTPRGAEKRNHEEAARKSRESGEEAAEIVEKTSEKCRNKAERKRRECGIFLC